MVFKYNKILIIGATSGIGLALATHCLENRISVVAVGRRKEQLEAFEKTHHLGATASSAQFDITNLSAIPAFVHGIFADHPDIDAVLINSGLQRPIKWTEPLSINVADINIEILTNYTAYMHLTVALLPYLQVQAPKQSCLLYMSSGLALVPLTYVPNYCATKAALHHHCLALRAQLKTRPDNNVKVVEILPPAVQTDLHVYQNPSPSAQRGMLMSDFIDETWKGLNEDGPRGEEIYVGQSVWLAGGGHEGGWEMSRQKTFAQLTEAARAS